MKPELNRRTFVATLATSLASTAPTAAQSIPIGCPTEYLELIAMGDRLPDLLQRYRDAARTVSLIVETWGPQWPTPDPEIIWYGNGSKRHADILDHGIETPWSKSGILRVQNIGTPEGFESDYQAHMKEAEDAALHRGTKSSVSL